MGKRPSAVKKPNVKPKTIKKAMARQAFIKKSQGATSYSSDDEVDQFMHEREKIMLNGTNDEEEREYSSEEIAVMDIGTSSEEDTEEGEDWGNKKSTYYEGDK